MTFWEEQLFEYSGYDNIVSNGVDMVSSDLAIALRRETFSSIEIKKLRSKYPNISRLILIHTSGSIQTKRTDCGVEHIPYQMAEFPVNIFKPSVLQNVLKLSEDDIKQL